MKYPTKPVKAEFKSQDQIVEENRKKRSRLMSYFDKTLENRTALTPEECERTENK